MGRCHGATRGPAEGPVALLETARDRPGSRDRRGGLPRAAGRTPAPHRAHPAVRLPRQRLHRTGRAGAGQRHDRAARLAPARLQGLRPAAAPVGARRRAHVGDGEDSRAIVCGGRHGVPPRLRRAGDLAPRARLGAGDWRQWRHARLRRQPRRRRWPAARPHRERQDRQRDPVWRRDDVHQRAGADDRTVVRDRGARGRQLLAGAHAPRQRPAWRHRRHQRRRTRRRRCPPRHVD